jgi:hypothetical protein
MNARRNLYSVLVVIQPKKDSHNQWLGRHDIVEVLQIKERKTGLKWKLLDVLHSGPSP